MRDLFIEIWESVRRNRLRTCLTGCAVAWGIFMLIVLLGAGNGLMNAFLNDSSDFDTNSMEVFGGTTSKAYGGYQPGRNIELTTKDMQILQGKAFEDNIDKVTTSVSKGNFTLNYKRKHIGGISLEGTFPGSAQLTYIKMAAGRFINEIDINEHRKVLVLTHTMARNLLEGSTDYEKIIGKRVTLNNISFLIVGVRKVDENQGDRVNYVPYTTLQSIYALGDKVNSIAFSFHGLPTEEANEQFESRVLASIASAHQAAPDDKSVIYIWNRFTQNLQMQSATKKLDTALWILGLFTLLSGIVGVSNIMLISVKERTHEFGIRKAIGARPWEVIKLIISESVVITTVFGYVGMVLGLIACEVLDATVGQSTMSLFGESIKMLDNPSVGIGTAIGATVVLIVAGTLAGLVPARKALKVKPIEALQAN